MADPIGEAVKALAHGRSLDAQAALESFGSVMRGEATPAQIAALLMGLRVKGESSTEVAGAARALREAMRRVDVPDPDSLVDTCGTGGGSIRTFNISTAAAFVAAGHGVRIAKHGNRSFTSACGSADVLEALGIAIDSPVDSLARVLDEAGMMFMFAPAMHPAMRHVGPVRRELAIPTIMNIVGPLANPAGARRQVVGVADRSRLDLIAGALRELGVIHAMVVHGDPGMDEISPLGASTVFEIRGDVVSEWIVRPSDYGITHASSTDLGGATPSENASVIREVLSGAGPAGARDAVLLNAAAAIYVSGSVNTFAEGVEAARQSIASGAALAALERLRGLVPKSEV